MALAHSISYPFTSKFSIPHGLACSFTLPEIARFDGETAAERLGPIAAGLGCLSEDIPRVLDNWFRALGVVGACSIGCEDSIPALPQNSVPAKIQVSCRFKL